MQNFTSRIRGTKLFLLSFVLFMGGLSMYGQSDCPTTSGTTSNQTFCYLNTVGEIVTDASDSRAYRSANATNPIPEDELLENGFTYFMGNADPVSCPRVEVTVNVTSSPAPVSGYGTTFSPALGSPSDSYNVDDLIATLQEDNPGENLVVFGGQFDETPLSGTTELIAENSYFVGISGGACPSDRLAMRYDPIVAVAPTGDATQTFCAGSTIGNLVATKTSDNTQAIRWYSTDTSNPNLDNDVVLVDGETYYATQIINNVGSTIPPTESEDRLEVTVTIIAPVNAGDDNTAALCSNDTVLDLSTLLSGDADTDGTFTLDGTNLNGEFNPSNYTAGTYTVTYAVENDCTSDEATFTVTLTEQPDAPVVTDEEFCETENATVADLGLTDVMVYDDAALTNELAPSTVLTTGIYYAVATSGSCASVSSDFEVTVSEQPDAPLIGDQEFCETENATVADLGAANNVSIYNDAALTNELDSSTALSTGTYYAIATNGSCISNTTEFDITVSEQPNAPEITGMEFCETENATVADLGLTDVMVYDDAALTNELAPSTALMEGTYYAIVTNGSCTSGTTEFEITITPVVTPEAGDDMSFDACINETIDLTAYLSEDAITTGEFSGLGVTGSSFTATTTDTYTVTYTVNDTNSCVTSGTSDSATFTITVNTPADANAGEDMAFDACLNENESIDLYTYLSDDASTSGEFTGDMVTDGMFMVTTAGTYTVTYSVNGNDSCVNGGTSDSATFTITVNTPADANAGEDMAFDACVNESIDLSAYLSDDAITSGEFTGDMVTDGMFMATTPGEYTVTYTVNEDDSCVNGGTSDDATFTIDVFSTDSIGEIEDQTFCSIVETDLYTILEDGVNNTGTFEGYTDGIFNETTPGEYTVTYSLDDSAPCVDGPLSTTFNVTVLETVTAGTDVSVSICENGNEIILADYLDANASAGGVFTDEDGNDVTTFDPTTAGEFIFTYTVTPINACGNETATLTVTVNELPDAPAVTDMTFCAIEGKTVAELNVAGQNVTYYSEANATAANMLDGTEVLSSGTYYATQFNDDGCQSATAAINVTVNDPGTPTIDASEFQICEYDERTVAYLTEGITSNGDITWYDAAEGGNAISESAKLVDGMTYYASASSAGCESAVRLEYKVNFTECELIFQEGISPNGDNINDTFDINYLQDEYPNYEIEIYNRWGNMVYKGNASTPNWDGTSTESSLGDDVLPVGVYFYVIEFNDGATPAKQGRVYLSR